MLIFNRIEKFLLKHCSPSYPILLALSGGPDSLFLFYSLLFFRKRHGTPFHIAHVDHGWRKESQAEAKALHQLALQHDISFHLKVLNPSLLQGNLEAACREERYAFFSLLCQQIPFQAVLTGHHRDDQAETIFKRLLEGAHWSRWVGLQLESQMHGMRILRPLLEFGKKDIQESLLQAGIKAFEDPTNQEEKFLRVRLRKTIFPHLNKEFGKEVQNSLLEVGKEAQELIDYFNAHLSLFLEDLIEGPWGICLDLQNRMPETLLELKYLLRLLSRRQQFFLSRPILEQAAQALKTGKANQLFEMGLNQVRIDRQRIFMMKASPHIAKSMASLKLEAGSYLLGEWRFNISKERYDPRHSITSWKEGWKGRLKGFLPFGNYYVSFKDSLDKSGFNMTMIKKHWNQAKIPTFLSTYFPLIWKEERICYEFLTGHPFIALHEGDFCWKIECTLIKNS